MPIRCHTGLPERKTGKLISTAAMPMIAPGTPAVSANSIGAKPAANSGPGIVGVGL